ncbi:MAG: 50S ribosomal protein L14e [Candidatus Micrarchaeia archaeon]
MAAIETGRVCVKKRGRDAGNKCVITKVIDSNYVEVETKERKKARKCAIIHLEPLPQKIDISNIEEIKKAIA